MIKNFIKNKYISNVLLFFVCWLFYGIIANIWVQFPDWDWFNYQHYNAWAFLNDRINTDFLAANYHSYINPYLNLVQYFGLLKLNSHPRIFIFLSVIDGAFLLFLTYKISDILLNFSKKWKYVFIFLSILYAALSPIMFEIMDFSRYDGYIAVLELLSFYILLKNLFADASKKRIFAIVLSGAFTGLAICLKLTGIVYFISIFLSTLFLHNRIEKPIKTLFIFTLSAFISFVLFDGYWLLLMYKHFHNPFFPYFNDVFKSEYYDKISIYDKDYVHLRPRSVVQFIFYPFLKNSNILCIGGDDRFLDYRYAISIVSIFIFAVFFKFKKAVSDKSFVFACLFVIISYYINVIIFANYRYIISVSVLFGIILIYGIYKIFHILKKDNYKYTLCTFLSVLTFVYATQRLGYKHFVPKNLSPVEKVLSIENLHIKDNSFVFLTCATSTIISNQNKHAKYMGYALSEKTFNERRVELGEKTDLWFNAFYLHSNYLENEIKSILNTNSNVYIIFNQRIWDGQMPIYKESLADYSNKRKLQNCRHVSVKLLNNEFKKVAIYMCEYNK